MKKLITLFASLFITYLSVGQTFKTSMYIAKESALKTEMVSNDIIITQSTITIKKFENGGASDCVMKIDRIENKPYMGAKCTWYFCTDTKKDLLSGTYYKGIFIYDKADKSIVYANFADEVSMYWYKFYLK